MISRHVIRSLACLVIGCLVPLSFAPYHLYALIIGLLVALLWLSKNVTAKWCLLYGYAFGLGYFGVGVHWLHISINLFGNMHIAIALFITYILVMFLAICPALSLYLYKKLASKQAYDVLLFPSSWVLLEWLRGALFTSFPWLNLGASQTDSWLADYFPLLGVYGVSFIVCLLAAAMMSIINRQRRLIDISIALSLIIIIGICPLLLKSVAWTTAKPDLLKVALIQGGIPQELKWEAKMRAYTFATYQSLTEPYWDSDLIVWPETALPIYYHPNADVILEINKKVIQHNTTLMTGLITKNNDEYFNSILIINGQHDEQHKGQYDEHGQHDFYHKNHLVPFGEYLPFKTWLQPLLSLMNIPTSNISAGRGGSIVRTTKYVAGLSICYEDAFGDEIRKSLPEADILVNVSNDAWFGDSLAPHQHLQVARVRALESGRYMIRATNTGVSTIINDKGEVVQKSPQFVAHALSAKVQKISGATPYVRFGNFPILIICIIILGMALRQYAKD